MFKACKKENKRICSEPDFSNEYFKLLYDAETSYYFNLSPKTFEYLLYVYKSGIDFYSYEIKNDDYAEFLTNKLKSVLDLNSQMQYYLNFLQLKTNINNKLKQLEEPEMKALFEKKLKEETNKKINKFKKNINSDIILIKLELRQQRNNFIKSARNKLFNKFIKNNYIIDKSNIQDQKNRINITPIKDFNNDIIQHQLMIRTKGASDNKPYLFPTEIFFDEDRNYLIKNNLCVFHKKEKGQITINAITKSFIEKFSLSYNLIIKEFIKKIIKLFNENYENKVNMYKEYKETISLFDDIMNDENYNKDLMNNEIGLLEENVKYLNEKEELNDDLNDKLIDTVDRFKINNPIDKIVINEIVNDYVYDILGLFA